LLASYRPQVTGDSVLNTSAGLLPYRRRDGRLEVFLVHPGGPFWANRDTHAWSVAKGEVERDEDLLDAARREFSGETGLTSAGPAMALAPVRQVAGKLVHVWAIEADIEPSAIQSNSFPLEWPPPAPVRSGSFRRLTAPPGSTLPKLGARSTRDRSPSLANSTGSSAGEQRIRMRVICRRNGDCGRIVSGV
jgi:predicted NUDIX family NTP pyrophosphohydrolase